jgi:hypothetical protein
MCALAALFGLLAGLALGGWYGWLSGRTHLKLQQDGKL